MQCMACDCRSISLTISKRASLMLWTTNQYLPLNHQLYRQTVGSNHLTYVIRVREWANNPQTRLMWFGVVKKCWLAAMIKTCASATIPAVSTIGQTVFIITST